MNFKIDNPESSVTFRDRRNECDSFERWSYKEIFLTHNIFDNTPRDLFYALRDNIIVGNRVKDIDDDFCYAFSENLWDTSYAGSNFQVQKTATTVIYNNVTIQQVNYPKVVEMSYYPDYSGFKKIWWCPNIGFVRLEYLDTLGNPVIWELIGGKPVL